MNSDDRRIAADREEQVHVEHAAWLARVLRGEDPNRPADADDAPDEVLEHDADGGRGQAEAPGSLIAALLRDGDESRGGSA